MLKTNPFWVIKNFIDQGSPDMLELTFSILQTKVWSDMEISTKSTRKNGTIRVHRPPNYNHMYIDVVENPAFRFVFLCSMPLLHHRGQRIKLPRPLANGHLMIDFSTLELNFTIDTPDPKNRVYVRQRYIGLYGMQEKQNTMVPQSIWPLV